jgi:hypothetical protein
MFIAYLFIWRLTAYLIEKTSYSTCRFVLSDIVSLPLYIRS